DYYCALYMGRGIYVF
nr:immunoglobulin light chain junction region [Macaca mulatta]MOW03860.1 immunoglobulin light chain junction region [Macaca mulatta]MOW16637.1 immunoglobulin light chain junction region [Macaca mulatta]